MPSKSDITQHIQNLGSIVIVHYFNILLTALWAVQPPRSLSHRSGILGLCIHSGIGTTPWVTWGVRMPRIK